MQTNRLKRLWRLFCVTAFVVFGLWFGLKDSIPFMLQLPPHDRAAVAIGPAIAAELLPRRWRADFWADLVVRLLTIAALCYASSELLFAWP